MAPLPGALVSLRSYPRGCLMLGPKQVGSLVYATGGQCPLENVSDEKASRSGAVDGLEVGARRRRGAQCRLTQPPGDAVPPLSPDACRVLAGRSRSRALNLSAPPRPLPPPGSGLLLAASPGAQTRCPIGRR